MLRQVRPGYDSLGQVRPGEDKLVDGRLGFAYLGLLGQVRKLYGTLGQVSQGQDRLGQVGKVRSDSSEEVMLGHFTLI